MVAIFSAVVPPVFTEREIRIRYGGGCDHNAMIPLRDSFPLLFWAELSHIFWNEIVDFFTEIQESSQEWEQASF